MVASSAYYVHTFTWHGPADSITVTGSFDNWSSSLQLELDSPSSTGLRRGTATPRKKGDTEDQQWTATCELDWGEKIVYKYIINNREWVHSMTEPHEADDSGNVNNVFIAPSLDIPHIPLSTPLEFTSTDRNLQVVRWDEDEFDDGEGKLEVLAGELHILFQSLAGVIVLITSLGNRNLHLPLPQVLDPASNPRPLPLSPEWVIPIWSFARPRFT
ncbi:hypothetical protein T439DRAFT_54288 [Meredithblackwellia eburnea MCA 4105]